MNAASVALMANAFGSATSSVFSALHTLCRNTGSGIITAAELSPAMLKVLVGAMQVTEFIAQCSLTEANGTYAKPGSVRSQWISSLITVT